MAGEAWEARIEEMKKALEWYSANGGTEPHYIRKGEGIRYYEAKLDSEKTGGITEWDAIRNLWQKLT